MPKFVIIPDRTPDLRTCITRRWLAGADLQTSPLRLRPVSVARDGSDGAFALTTEINAQNNEIALRLHHVSAAGVVNGPLLLSSSSNVWFYSAFVVPSKPGSCIAIWTSGGWGATILAQRFDTNLNPLWPAAVALSNTSLGFDHVAAASDGDGGAYAAFKDNSSGNLASAKSFRVQRVSSTGALPWGPTGTALVTPGTSAIIPTMTPQIAVGLLELAVVWESFDPNTPAVPPTVSAAWVDPGGQVLSGPFTVGTTMELTGLSQRWAITDPDGGFYVALQPLGAKLTLRRFDSRATTEQWTAHTQITAAVASYALAEDGSGGALLATLGAGGQITASRFNRQGGNQWATAAATNVATVALPPGPPTGPGFLAVTMALAAKAGGGAILVYSDFQQPAAPRLHSRCFDSSGAFFGKDNEVSPLPGSQLLPLVSDMVVPSTHPLLVKPVGGHLGPADPQGDSLTCIWQAKNGASGTTVSGQKLGCCKTTYNGVLVVVPEFGCGVPIEWPPTLPGTINAIFPCGSPKGTFGLLPVPHLSHVTGVNLPGGLATASVPAPDWVRLWFDHVPPEVSIEMRTHKNAVIASATRLDLPTGIEEQYGRTSTLTFQPNKKLSYVLVFNRPRDAGTSAVVPLGLRIEFGSGDAPPISLPRTGPGPRRAAARAVRKGTRKRTRR